MSDSAFRLVELQREEFDTFSWYGFVVSETAQLMLLHFVSDRYDLDGYRCIRQQDISLLELEFERKDLVERALRLKKLSPAAPRVTAQTDMRTMMEEVQREYGLLTIYREEVYLDGCDIGQVRMSSETTYVLRWLDPNAEWDLDHRPFRYADVTRLDIDSEYERTLLMVAEDRERGA